MKQPNASNATQTMFIAVPTSVVHNINKLSSDVSIALLFGNLELATQYHAELVSALTDLASHVPADSSTDVGE